ncbi:MAG: hypothetical protein ACR2IF_07030 [Terriglobales bacterium]
MWQQHEVYSKIVGLLVHCACEQYKGAEKFVGARGDLGDAVESLKSFDHRVMQEAHDLIAAWYRFSLVDPPLFPRQPDHVQEDWLTFAERETREITRDYQFARAVLEAVVYAHQPKGTSAERNLEYILSNRYRRMFEFPAATRIAHPE